MRTWINPFYLKRFSEFWENIDESINMRLWVNRYESYSTLGITFNNSDWNNWINYTVSGSTYDATSLIDGTAALYDYRGSP